MSSNLRKKTTSLDFSSYLKVQDNFFRFHLKPSHFTFSQDLSIIMNKPNNKLWLNENLSNYPTLS